jgi:hypothetical protein
MVQLYNGSRQKIRAKIFKPEQGGAKLRARKSRTLLKALLTNTSNAHPAGTHRR